MQLIDILGRTFGRWTVIEQAPNLKRHDSRWVCQCTCGNKSIVGGRNLRDGRSKGCKPCALNAKRGVPLGPSPLRLPLSEKATNVIFGDYRQGARVRGLAFRLSREAFGALITAPCTYCGRPPFDRWVDRRAPDRGVFLHGGVDRKDNTIGYTPENSVACCADCNWAKGDRMTADQFMGYLALAGRYALQLSRQPKQD